MTGYAVVSFLLFILSIYLIARFNLVNDDPGQQFCCTMTMAVFSALWPFTLPAALVVGSGYYVIKLGKKHGKN